MMEVFRNTEQSTAENNTENVAANTADWSILTKEEWRDPEEQSAFELSEVELSNLSDDEVYLFENNPELFSQLYRLKAQQPELNLQPLDRDLARYIELAIEDGRDADLRYSDEAVAQLATMYSELGEDAGYRTNKTILRCDSEEIAKAKRCYDEAKRGFSEQEASVEKPAKTRVSFVRSILGKLQKRKNNESIQRMRSKERFDFLNHLVGNFHPDLMDENSVFELAKLAQQQITQDADYSTAVHFATIWFGMRPSDEILNFVQVRDEIDKSNVPLEVKNARAGLEYNYFDIFGMNSEKREKFVNEILPKINNEKTARLQKLLVDNISKQASTTEKREEFDFAVNELAPRITDKESKDYNVKQELLYGSIISWNLDIPTSRALANDVDNHILPFAMKERPHFAAEYAKDLMPGILFNDMERTKLQDEVSREKWLEDVLRKYDEHILPLLNHVDDISEHGFDLMKQFLHVAAKTDFEPEFITYLHDKIFPMIENNDNRLGSLKATTNVRGEERYQEYDFDCLTAKIVPWKIGELLYRQRELPASDAERLEQNRLDALAIEKVIVPIHDFIHDEDPNMHELLAAMLDYYETGGEAGAEARLREIAKRCPADEYGTLEDKIYDLANYEIPINGEVKDDNTASINYDEKAVDILRRLVENTNREAVEIPKVDDEIWLELMKNVGMQKEFGSNKIRVDWKDVGELARYVNDWLSNNQGKYGLNSEKLNAIAFTKRAVTAALRNISEKDRQELPYDETFKEFVKLQELTESGDKFSPADFERFWDGFRNVRMGDEDSLKEHYLRLVERESIKAGKLAREIEGTFWKNNRGRFVERQNVGWALQSGGVLHEMIKLLEARDTNTLRGRVDAMVTRSTSNQDSGDEDLSEETI